MKTPMTAHKAAVALAGFLALVIHVLSDGAVSGAEVGELVGGALVAAGVWAVPNEPKPPLTADWPYQEAPDEPQG